ncbi:MAG: hypothetical protein WC180_02595 [Candidatus Paceibacterota bacterium]|jgi:hypothetical protein
MPDKEETTMIDPCEKELREWEDFFGLKSPSSKDIIRSIIGTKEEE